MMGPLQKSFPNMEEYLKKRFKKAGRPLKGSSGLWETIHSSLMEFPDSVLCSVDGRNFSNGFFEEGTCKAAARLRQLAVGPEEIVAICADDGGLLLVSILAVWRVGAAFVILEPSLPIQMFGLRIREARCKIILTDFAINQSLSSFYPSGTTTLLVDEVVGEIGRSGGFTSVQPGSVLEEEPSRRSVPANLACLVYSAGTNASPKGVLLSYAVLGRATEWLRDVSGILSGDVAIHSAPYGSGDALWQILVPLLGGARLAFPPHNASQNEAWRRNILIQERVSLIFLCPRDLWNFADACRSDKELWSDTNLKRICVIGGAPSPKWMKTIRETLPGVALEGLYGMVESAMVGIWGVYHTSDKRSFLHGTESIPAIGNFNEVSEPCDLLETGEMLLGGGYSMRAYLHRPNRTYSQFFREPNRNSFRFLSGDTGRRVSDAAWEIIGNKASRTSHQERRIEICEIERVLQEHDLIREASVCLRQAPDGARHQTLAAYLVTESAEKVSVANVKSFLLSKLPAYMVPDTFWRTRALPYVPNGKLDRRAFPLKDAQPLENHQEARLLTPLEAELSSIWISILGIPIVDIQADFFDLGGHSLLAGKIVARIRERIEPSLTLAMFFKNSSIASLAKLFEAGPLLEGRPDRAIP
jgi:acyl-coenzyme A synthetase/AMP-(fatty) acid ligase